MLAILENGFWSLKAFSSYTVPRETLKCLMLSIAISIVWCWIFCRYSLIARFMGPTWGPSGADRTQVGPMLAPWTLLSRLWCSSLNPIYSNSRWMAKDIMIHELVNSPALLNWYDLIKADNELDLQINYHNELSLSSKEPCSKLCLIILIIHTLCDDCLKEIRICICIFFLIWFFQDDKYSSNESVSHRTCM